MAKLSSGKPLTGDGKAIFAFFVGAIIAVTFLATIATSVIATGQQILTTNQTITVPAVNGTLDLTGRELIGTPIIVNSTNHTIPQISVSTTAGNIANNFTVTTQISSGGLTVQLLATDQAGVHGLTGFPVNITYQYFPDGYLSQSGARTINNLVILISALAILVFGIVVLIKTGSLGRLIREG